MRREMKEEKKNRRKEERKKGGWPGRMGIRLIDWLNSCWLLSAAWELMQDVIFWLIVL